MLLICDVNPAMWAQRKLSRKSGPSTKRFRNTDLDQAHTIILNLHMRSLDALSGADVDFYC